MIKYSYICLPLAALFLSASMPLRAQGKKPTTDRSKSTEEASDEDEEEGKGLEIGKLLPLNKPNLMVKIPGFDDKGELTTMVEAETLTRVDDVNLKLENSTIQLVPQGLTIKLRTAFYNTEGAILSSNQTTTVSSKEFTITGATMDFDTKTGKGRMIGPTRMLIHNVSAMGGEEKETKSATGASSARSGAAVARSNNQEEPEK